MRIKKTITLLRRVSGCEVWVPGVSKPGDILKTDGINKVKDLQTL